MAEPERATLDMTAIRDVVFEDRERHPEGVKLLGLAARGEVELGVPPQGSLADLGPSLEGDLAQRIKTLLGRPGVVGLPQVARLSDVTFPGEDLSPGYFVEGFAEAWDAVVADWKTHEGKCPGDLDRWYVESHLAGKRDVLVTNDDPLRAMCSRLREHGLVIVAEPLREYAARH